MGHVDTADMHDGAAVTADAAVEAAAALLRGRGERLTSPRVAVVRVLAGRHDHLTAEQVVAAVAQTAPAVHRASVYRALDTLAGLGVVAHVHLGHGTTTYHLGAPHLPEHLHAQCVDCGRVFDLPADTLDGVVEHVVAVTGFRLEPSHVALSGTCEACALLRAGAR
jgi:Fur family ferric uptake transcriptional regulator